MRNSIVRCVFLLAACVGTSCKKDDAGSRTPVPTGYYLMGNIDGQSFMSASPVAEGQTYLPGVYLMRITGLSSNHHLLQVDLATLKNAFTANTWYGIQSYPNDSVTLNTGLGVYISNNGIMYSTQLFPKTGMYAATDSMNRDSSWYSQRQDGKGIPVFDCTFSEITSTYVKGTFSGTIYEDNSSNSSKAVSSGSFYAPIQMIKQ